MSPARFRLLLAGGLLLAVAIPRLLLSTCVTDFGADGGYYTDIAQNVRDGLGLSTDVSVFHQGFPVFPYRTPVYPVWPAIYGVVARFAPIQLVGVWLPTLLHVAMVALAWRLGRRLAPRIELGSGLPFPRIHGGVVLAVATLLTSELARATSRPYTEGVAFTLLFGLFLRAPTLWGRLGLRAGLEMGAWLMLLFLTRSQFVVVGIAAVLALGVAAWRRPASALAFGVGAAAVCGATWAAYASWLGQAFPNPSLTTFVRFDLARLDTPLSAIPVMAPTSGPLERLADIARGFQVSASLYASGSAYYNLHNALVFALPAALLVLAFRAGRLPTLLRFARSPAAANAAFFTAAAAGLLLSLHTVHKVYGSPWVFGGRHAIGSLFAFSTCLLFLLRGRGLVRTLGVLVLVVGTYGGWRSLVIAANDACASALTSPGLVAYRAPVRSFLLSERDRLDGLTVAVERPEAQRLAWRTPGVGFHWLSDTTSVDDLAYMVRALGVAYVVDFEDVGFLTAPKDPRFAEFFTPYVRLEERGVGEDEEAEAVARVRTTRVYAPRCAAFPRSPTCR